jgi:hypothetical protein
LTTLLLTQHHYPRRRGRGPPNKYPPTMETTLLLMCHLHMRRPPRHPLEAQGQQEAISDNPSHHDQAPLPIEEAALVGSAPTDNDNTSHPPAAGSDDYKQRAVQLLDGIRERFEGWRKLDRGVPPVFQPVGNLGLGGRGSPSSSSSPLPLPPPSSSKFL